MKPGRTSTPAVIAVLLALLVTLAIAGCSGAPASRSCEADTDCRAGEGCLSGRCRRATGDAAIGTSDGGGGVDGGPGPIDAASAPEGEAVCDGLDSDGDGLVDEGCSCMPGEVQRCYPGDPSETERGPCAFGTQGCDGAGEFGMWTECIGAIVPSEDDCGDRIDDDCNGIPDDGSECVCSTGESRACYSGPDYTRGVGICMDGRQECSTVPGVGWGECLDEVLPRDEICGNGRDDDCNGAIDDGIACACTDGATRDCYSGPPSEAGVGVCRRGTQRCINGGTMWSECAGEVGPTTEVCGNGLDDDCDGMNDDGCPTIVNVEVNLDGDCVSARCPTEAPYPVGCMINMAGSDGRGCVASTPTSPVVYFQEGDRCGAGRVTGTLSCSSTPGAGLDASNCIINKPSPYYPETRSGCPRT